MNLSCWEQGNQVGRNLIRSSSQIFETLDLRFRRVFVVVVVVDVRVVETQVQRLRRSRRRCNDAVVAGSA